MRISGLNGVMPADRFFQRHRIAVLLVSFLAPLLACALLALVRGAIDNTNAALILVLIIVGAASTGLRWAGILVGAAVTEICLWGRRQQAKASRESGYLSGVLSAAEQIGAGSAPAVSVIEHVQQQLIDVLDLDTARFQEATSEQLPTLEPDGDVMVGAHKIDVDRQGLPTDSELRLLVRNAGVTHGEFLLTASTHVARPTVEQRKVACLLADQVGAALALEGR
jgi:hypothetical protein